MRCLFLALLIFTIGCGEVKDGNYDDGYDDAAEDFGEYVDELEADLNTCEKQLKTLVIGVEDFKKIFLFINSDPRFESACTSGELPQNICELAQSNNPFLRE